MLPCRCHSPPSPDCPAPERCTPCRTRPDKCWLLLWLLAGCPTWRYTATPPSTKPVGLPEPIQPEQDSVLMVMFTIPFTPGPGHVARDTRRVTRDTRLLSPHLPRNCGTRTRRPRRSCRRSRSPACRASAPGRSTRTWCRRARRTPHTGHVTRETCPAALTSSASSQGRVSSHSPSSTQLPFSQSDPAYFRSISSAQTSKDTRNE